MKKLILNIAGLVLLATLFVACEKNEEEPIYDKSQTVSPVLLSPSEGTTMVWTEADSMKSLSFNWAPAIYTLNSGASLEMPEYSLTVSLNGGLNEVISTTDTTATFTVPELNSMFLGWGIQPATETSVVWTVTANLPEALTTVFSDAVNTKVTAFKTADPPAPSAASLYVPGAYQGWDPANAPQIWDNDDDGIFEGYVYITGEDFNFKFASQPNWDGPNYGTDGTEFGLDTDAGAGNLTVPAAGGYWLVCNTNDLVYSYELQNFGVIGSGILNGDWTEDVDMLPAEGGPYNILEVTIDVSESADGDLRFKYRANDAWDISYGADAGSDVLISGGSDILMPEGPGNYTFKMLWDTPTPRYELIKN